MLSSFRAPWVRALCVCSLCVLASPLGAQTDFYNTDRGRPLRTEDAVVIERRAIELQAIPVTASRAGRGLSAVGVAPSIAFGLLPRTQLEIGFPVESRDDLSQPGASTGLAGIEVEALHQLNIESRALPAFALGAGVHLGTGPLAPTRSLGTVRALATRTLGWGRVHLNGAYTLGDALAATDPGADDASRWEAGLAIDHTFFFRSLLAGAEVVARTPMALGAPTEWEAGVGVRHQLSPRLAVDAGLRRRLASGSPSWGLTFGGAYAFARGWRAPASGAAPEARGDDRAGTAGTSRATGTDAAAATARDGTDASARAAASPWITTYEQFYLQAPHNFTFRRRYPAADRLFNAFDYGHAILYELLWSRPSEAQQRLEGAVYDRLTTQVLDAPPRLPLVEDAIEPRYARLAPEAKMMFEWAHLLHRQAYDILADERLDDRAKDAEMGRLLAYYRSRPDLAFSVVPKNMSLMQEQPYSLAFRQAYPKFNGLIWAYHWLQVGLYEPLVVGRTSAERQAGVMATVARFRQMIPGAPDGYPPMMPMTAAIAPTFATRWPEIAIIFDNLHSMHDVISDILANESVPRAEKRTLILKAAYAFRDDTTEVMTVAGWRKMSLDMGVDNQGGPAVGFLPALPVSSMSRGMVMRYDRDGNPRGGEQHHHHP